MYIPYTSILKLIPRSFDTYANVSCSYSRFASVCQSVHSEAFHSTEMINYLALLLLVLPGTVASKLLNDTKPLFLREPQCASLASWTDRRFSLASCRLTFENAKYTKAFPSDASFASMPEQIPSVTRSRQMDAPRRCSKDPLVTSVSSS